MAPTGTTTELVGSVLRVLAEGTTMAGARAECLYAEHGKIQQYLGSSTATPCCQWSAS